MSNLSGEQAVDSAPRAAKILKNIGAAGVGVAVGVGLVGTALGFGGAELTGASLVTMELGAAIWLGGALIEGAQNSESQPHA